MTRTDLAESAEAHKQKIEKFLATSGKRGVTLSQVAEGTGIALSTVKRHLEHLYAMHRVDVETYGTFSVYRMNGVGEYQDRVDLSPNHQLYIDTLLNYKGEPFLRIKERKKMEDGWKDMGSVIVDPSKVKELVDKLSTVASNSKKYTAGT